MQGGNIKQLATKFSDQLWRLNNLYKIRNKEGKRVRFALNSAQCELYEQMWYLNVILKARQLGFSTFIDLFILDTCIFNPDIKAGIIAHHMDDAKAIYNEKIKFPYEHLDPGIRSHITAKTDRADEIQFSNGSSIRVSTSFRSGTLQLLHVSEYGKIAAKYPEKAREIKTGAFEAVAAGQQIFVESTAEGREGEFFDLCEDARKKQQSAQQLTKLDFKFFFFPWHYNPEYKLHEYGGVLTTELLRYFKSLEARGIRLTIEQKHWYAQKIGVLKDDMRREHPSIPEEAFEASIQGAYYETEMSKMRREGRIGVVPHDSSFGVDVFWDLGMDDAMSLVFIQEVGAQKRCIDYYENSGEGFDHYARELQERPYVYRKHYMPHDISVRELGSQGKTRKQIAEQLGIKPIDTTKRPRNTDELLSQIEVTRSFLRTLWIDAEKCDRLIKCLDNYRKEWDEKAGAFKRTPRHGWESHGADAMRTGAVNYRPYVEYEASDLMPEWFED